MERRNQLENACNESNYSKNKNEILVEIDFSVRFRLFSIGKIFKTEAESKNIACNAVAEN